MKTENQQTRKNCKHKLTSGIAVKLMLVAFSFVQAYWVPIACAAGTVAVAAMFGDKAYWSNFSKEVEKVIGEKEPGEAVKYLEAELAKYSKWRQENPDSASHFDKRINDLCFQLAKAKEVAGIDKNQVIDAYKRAVASPRYGGEALAWLCQNTSNMKRRDVFKQVLQEAPEGKQVFRKIVQELEKSNDWNAFESFIGTVFESATDHVSTAKSIENHLEKGSKWRNKFVEYCRSKPKLMEYVYGKDCERAEELVKKEEFKKAVAAYRDLAERYKMSAEQKADIEFRICQCLFNLRDYNTALSELNGFLERNKAKSRKLVKEVLLLKGQCYIQQGEFDKATNVFLTLMIEFPETKESPEASFFVGYSYMLQGKFDLAKEAFNLVVKDYPQSSYASKAKLCLTRIESMTE